MPPPPPTSHTLVISQLTCHTSRLAPHNTLLTRPTFHLTLCFSQLTTLHTSHIAPHTSHFAPPSSHLTHLTLFSSHLTSHISHLTRHLQRFVLPLPMFAASRMPPSPPTFRTLVTTQLTCHTSRLYNKESAGSSSRSCFTVVPHVAWRLSGSEGREGERSRKRWE